MKEISNEIRNAINEASGILSEIKPAEAALKKGSEEWSKKEILGHLIDSAENNHQRIVRAVCNPAGVVAHVYDQVGWVRVQHYQELDWGSLLTLWVAYNQHLCNVIERVPEAALSARCDIGKPEIVSLEFIIRDYLRHLKHHLGDLLRDNR